MAFREIMALPVEAAESHVSKRSRPCAHEIFPMLCHMLHAVCTSAEFSERRKHAASSEHIGNLGSTVEIEVRVGMLVDGVRRMHPQTSSHGCYVYQPLQPLPAGVEFKAGLDEGLLGKVKRALQGAGFTATKLPTQTLHSDALGNRWEVLDASGRKTVVQPERKSRFARFDFALVAHTYDIRLDAAVEKAIAQSTTSSIDPDKWTLRRSKRRVSYARSSGHWRVDLTEVDSLSSGRTAVETHETELEIELEQRTVLWLLGLADEGEDSPLKKAIAQVIEELYRTVYLCVSSNVDVPSHTPASSVSDSAVAAVRALTTQLAGGRHVDFLGAMPASMSRRSLERVLTRTYFATEKSDGTRKLLYVVREGGVERAVLVDRAQSMQVYAAGPIVGRDLRAGTVLDGELVFHLTTRKHLFLVFDILALNGESLMHRRFSERLDEMKRVFSHCSDSPGLVPKVFFEKTKVGELLRRIRHSDGHRVYHDESNGIVRHHRTDGLIFQPDSPYRMGTDVDLVKWKYADLMTVDLQVEKVVEKQRDGVTREVLKLMAGGPERGIFIDCTAHASSGCFGKFAEYRLNADLMQAQEDRPHQACIAEVAYNPQVGLWEYFHFREDKASPNNISTVLSVFMEQAEGIEVEELEYRLLARSEAENDYSAQLASMKTKALEFQRSGRGAPKKK